MAALLPLAALLLLGLLFLGHALWRDPNVQPRALVGKPVPALTLPEMDSGRPEPVTLQPVTGETGPYLINFFASWCAPCELEQPTLMALKADGVTIVGIAYKDAPVSAQGFLTRLGDPFTRRLIDRDGRAGLEFGVTGVPETYLVGADGRILDKHSGPLDEESARALLSKAR
ncbi:MAG: DsbE family thiol:disulfide interchange protein [Caulobacter sp.]|nr:DsbE family thiol:disulfide interchange protein [Caulobacter sp.]